MGAAHPRFAPILCHLHALEAYRLAGYRKVLLCDGDLLFRQPVGELFDTQDLLLCCADQVFLAGRCRDAATFMPVAAPSCAGVGGRRRPDLDLLPPVATEADSKGRSTTCCRNRS